MAKKGAGDVPATVALIAGALAATVSRDGVMAGAHDEMIALQAYRVHNALERMQEFLEEDPELLHEPITDKAIHRFFELKKEKAKQVREHAEREAAEAAAKAAAAEKA